MRHAVAAHEPDPRGNEHHHGEADPADIRLHAENDPEKVANEHAHERADREEGDSEDRHREALLTEHGLWVRCKALRTIESPPCMRGLAP